MSRLLTPQRAADALGVHVGTLRRWEREGKITAIRTTGNQRRFLEENVIALRDGVRAPATNRRPAPRSTPPEPATPPRLAPAPRPAWQPPQPVPASNTSDVKHDTKVVMSPLATVLALQTQQMRETNEQLARQREAAQRAHVERQRQQARQAEQRRLEELKSHGRGLALSAPTDWQAKVTRELERYITPEQFPATLSSWTAREYVKARVDKVLEGWRTAEQDRRRVAHLIAHGQRYAAAQTSDWDREARNEAQEDVERALDEEVRPEWTERRVEDLVDDVLGEWSGE